MDQQQGHSAQIRSCKLASCNTFMLSILEFIFLATSHKLLPLITYDRFGNLSLFASYAMLMRPKKTKTAVHCC